MAHRTPPSDDPLRRWLAAELEERDLEAEAALAELLGDLPRPAPPAGFAERVMLAVAASPAAAVYGALAGAPVRVPLRGRGLAASRWVRAAVVSTLAVAALAAVSLPGAVLALLDMVSTSDVLSLAGRWLAAALAACADGLGVLLRFEPIGRAAALVLSTPQVSAALALCLLASAAAFYLLHDLLHRSWSHVHPV
jgi:hypothetical protein